MLVPKYGIHDMTPDMRKPVFLDFHQLWHKPACAFVFA